MYSAQVVIAFLPDGCWFPDRWLQAGDIDLAEAIARGIVPKEGLPETTVAELTELHDGLVAWLQVHEGRG